MGEYLEIHPADPQPRLISQAVRIIRGGGIVVYPTDSCYALGCHIGDKTAMERIRRLRNTDKKHYFTLACRDLSEIANYARVDNWAYRLLKKLTPGPYTFLLRATREVPKRLQNPRRRTVGIRVPDHPIVLALLEELGEPLMTSTLKLPGDDLPLNDPQEIRDRLGHAVDAIIDGGLCGLESTTVLDLGGDWPAIVRQGIGKVSGIE